MHCPNCGTLLPEGAKFCTNFGQPLPVNGEQASAEKQPAAEPVNETASEDGTYVTNEFISYVRPLIQGDVSPVMVDGIPRHLISPKELYMK